MRLGAGGIVVELSVLDGGPLESLDVQGDSSHC